jgi:hypothetical protein
MALIFVPMSLTANILSLDRLSQPTEPLFWVYFAISVPLTLVLFVCMMVFRANVHEDECSVIDRLAKLVSLRRQKEDLETARGLVNQTEQKNWSEDTF